MSEEQPTQRKRGKLSLEEMKFIKENYNKLPVEDIAKRLNRHTDPVIRYMKEQDLFVAAKTNRAAQYREIKEKLFREKFWEQIKSQLQPAEENFFIDSWVRYVQQFASDVLPTEELQIKDLVMLDILQARIMAGYKVAQSEIARLQSEVDDELRKDAKERDKDRLNSLNQTISAIQTATQRSNRDVLEYQAKKGDILEKMHADRQARVKNLKNLKIDFAALMRQFDDEEKRELEGVEMELRSKAAEAAREKLAGWHVYGDGIADRPLLNCDTIGDVDE
jgi:hypothetical protein